MFSLLELTDKLKEKFNEELVDLVFLHKQLKLDNSNYIKKQHKLINDNVTLSDGGCAFILCKDDKNKINLKITFKMKNKFMFQNILTNKDIMNCLDPNRGVEQFNNETDLLNIIIFQKEEQMSEADNLSKFVSNFLCYQCNDNKTLFYINQMIFNYFKQNGINYSKNDLKYADKVMAIKKSIPVKAEKVKHDTKIKTLEGTMQAHTDDWIITGVNGEKYPIKKEIFEKTYKIVSIL